MRNVLQREGIDISNCIGDANDGASSMQRIYKGLFESVKEDLPTHVHTWCYAYVLNFVTGDVTGKFRKPTRLLKLLNDITYFFKQSYKRMKKWEQKEKNKSPDYWRNFSVEKKRIFRENIWLFQKV